MLAQSQSRCELTVALFCSCSAAHVLSAAAAAASSSSNDDVYDVIVIGVGAMGVSTCYHLAKADKKVLGLERFTIAHSHGSSHGETRITRLAYWEHPNYVPLLRRSFELVSQLERESGEKLFHQTGSLDIGPEDEATFQGSVLSCLHHNLPHEILTPSELASRFPAWCIPAHFKACFQPAGGMLFPEKLNEITAKLARERGADIRENVEVVDIVPTGEGVEVIARGGKVFRGRKVLLSAGAWQGSLINHSSLGLASPRLRALASMLRPERQVVSWYEPSSQALSDKRFDPARFPVWISTLEGAHFYGFPEKEGGTRGVKIGQSHTQLYDHVMLLASLPPHSLPLTLPLSRSGRYHHRFEQLSESDLNDTARRALTEPVDRTYTAGFMRSMFGSGIASEASTGGGEEAPAVLHESTCVFTNTPDEHFILDRCPDKNLPQIAFVSACSGHGFKFSTAIGEALSQMLLRSEGEEAGPREKIVQWLDAGRLLGDRPPLQALDPHVLMKERLKKEGQRAKL